MPKALFQVEMRCKLILFSERPDGGSPRINRKAARSLKLEHRAGLKGHSTVRDLRYHWAKETDRPGAYSGSGRLLYTPVPTSQFIIYQN